MATPNSANLYLGAGEIWFNRFDSSGNKTQWRHLGNVDKFELNPNVQLAEKYSSMNGARGLLSRAVTQTGAELSLTLTEFDPENLALGFLGQTAAFSQISGTATDTAVTGVVKKGQALDTGKRKITVTGVKKAPSTALVLNTDYTVDSDSGLITALSTSSTLSDGDSLLWSGSYPLIASTLIQALSNAIILGAMRFRSASDATGPRYLVDVWKASISPDGALGFIGKDYGEIPMKASLLQDTTQPAGNQFYQAILL